MAIQWCKENIDTNIYRTRRQVLEVKDLTAAKISGRYIRPTCTNKQMRKVIEKIDTLNDQTMDINYRTRCIIYRVQQMSKTTLPFNLTSISDSTTEEICKIIKNTVYILDRTQQIINIMKLMLRTADKLGHGDVVAFDAVITDTDYIFEQIKEKNVAININIEETYNKIDYYINDNIKLYIKEQIEVDIKNQVPAKTCQNLSSDQNVQEILQTDSNFSSGTVDEDIQQKTKQLKDHHLVNIEQDMEQEKESVLSRNTSLCQEEELEKTEKEDHSVNKENLCVVQESFQEKQELFQEDKDDTYKKLSSLQLKQENIEPGQINNNTEQKNSFSENETN
ncbi:hypothetical protein CDIK_2892 [Cucumispora dikerogammari]|nr:hypothetical protein CDIK_2892 [Cucumispora dikerogammari]